MSLISNYNRTGAFITQVSTAMEQDTEEQAPTAMEQDKGIKRKREEEEVENSFKRRKIESEDGSESCIVYYLPDEIWANVHRFLSIRDFGTISLVCKHWKMLSEANSPIQRLAKGL